MENSIELKFNEITEIPMQLIPNKERIVSINFSNNKIKFIPKDIGLFTTLSQLYLDYNLIEVVPKEMEALFALQILDLSTFFLIFRRKSYKSRRMSLIFPSKG